MFTTYQKFVVAMLVFLQFTLILDFMIISPMGALIMPALNISPAQFGVIVSVYAFAAGASGILASGFADRFDRKRLLLFFYAGFLVGTFLCGLAETYETLVFARMLTGLFGGVIGSIVMAITTDLFPMEKRGRVIGLIQTAFAASQVLGIPAGLFFSNLWGWDAPFIMISVLGLGAGLLIVWKLQPVDGHLKLQIGRHPIVHMKETVLNRDYTLAFCATALLSTGGFLLMPFASDFTVHNLGIDMAHLPIIYLCTGLSSLMILPLVGRLADTFGKYRTFVLGGILTITMVFIYTHLGHTPLPMVVLVNVLLFTGIFSRMVPAQAMMSAVPEAANRGSFMAVSSSLQQMSGGIAAVLAGFIVTKAPDGHLIHYNIAGYVLAITVVASIVMLYFIDRKIARGDGEGDLAA